ncbi:MAG TPA: ABC transporter substrate-binding protein [Stellaceae bacterium]|nr:ABC transporter substrate-binding protein [Stellaceae bacterium]
MIRSSRGLAKFAFGAVVAAGFVAGMAFAPSARAADTKVTFGTDWFAEAEHGGFYQALAKGFYKKHGLDVTIKMGGPQANPMQAVATGIVDLQMSSGSFGALSAAQQDIPVIAVAAFFQKDPQCVISHPGTGHDTLALMKGQPIMISAAARTGYWLFLSAKFGFTDSQIRPYNYSLAPFLADKTAIQQGFVTSEPYQIEKQAGEKPVVNLLADNGYSSYSNVVLTQTKMVKEHPEVVKAFVEASIEGWYSYMYGDPKPGNDLILKDNKDITQDVLDASIKLMKQYALVDSGDSTAMGVGAMTDARWKDFFDTMSKAGLYPASVDYKKAFTTQFVDQKYAIDMRKGG